MSSGRCCWDDDANLIRLAGAGDRHAFDLLYARYQRRIFDFIYCRVHDFDLAENLRQDAFMRAWCALSRGSYKEVGAFSSWLHRIASNLVSDWFRLHSTAEMQLSPDGDAEGQPGWKEQQSHDPPVDQIVERQEAYQFLISQLDEVLIPPADSPDARGLGLLKKLAFVEFYVDGLRLPEIVAELSGHASAMGIRAPASTQVSNWLSRGDILAALVRHLVEAHPGWMGDTIQRVALESEFSDQELKIIRLRWQAGQSPDSIAAGCNLPLGETQVIIEDLAKQLAQLLCKDIKAELHRARKKG